MIEDSMSIPGQTTESVSVQDYSSDYRHDQPIPDGAEELSLCRASIERALEKQCRRQEYPQIVATADGVFDAGAPIDGPLSHTLAVADHHDLETFRRDIGMYPAKNKQVAISSLDASFHH
jgi:hypothetical protein